MTDQEIIEKMREVLVEEFEVEADEVTPEANFFSDLDLDSLDAIDLVINMDKLLGVKLKGQDAQNIKTVQDFVELIQSKLNA